MNWNFSPLRTALLPTRCDYCRRIVWPWQGRTEIEVRMPYDNRFATSFACVACGLRIMAKAVTEYMEDE